MNLLRRLAGLVSHNIAWKVAALFASTALWIAINGSEPNADRYVRLGVSTFGLPKRLVISERIPGTVEVQLRGPRSILRTVNEDTHRVALDLRGVRAGTTTITVTPEMLNLPRRIRVVRISPQRLDLRIERLLRKAVPVKAILVPAERNGYTISDVSVTPPEVEVFGPAGRIERAHVVETAAVSTLGVTGYVERDAPVADAGEWLSFFPNTVRVGFAVREIEGQRTFPGIAVLIHDGPRSATVLPSTVTVVLRGPERRLPNLRLDEAAAYVEAGNLDPGQHDLAVQVTVPQGFRVHRVLPATVRLTIEHESPAVGGEADVGDAHSAPNGDGIAE